MSSIYSNLFNIFIWVLIIACLFQCCCQFRKHRERMTAAQHQPTSTTTATTTTTTTIPAPTPENAEEAAALRSKVIKAMFPEQKIENDTTLVYDAESNGYQWTNNNTGDASCSICLENFEPGDTIVTSSCNHAYHRDCLMGWLSLKDECPNCRQAMWEPEAYQMFEQDIKAMDARATILS